MDQTKTDQTKMDQTKRDGERHSDTHRTEVEKQARNPDPITGAPGAHPVGTGTGAAVGGATGALIGAVVGGPVGAIAGGVIGAVGGGYAGKATAESLDPTVEEAYWRESYPSRPYHDRSMSYDDYAPAYRYGWESWSKRDTTKPSARFEDTESELRDGWDRTKLKTRLTWEQAKDAVRDSWERLSNRVGRDDLAADDDGMAVEKNRPMKKFDGRREDAGRS